MVERRVASSFSMAMSVDVLSQQSPNPAFESRTDVFDAD
jgi:hypothetical protein